MILLQLNVMSYLKIQQWLSDSGDYTYLTTSPLLELVTLSIKTVYLLTRSVLHICVYVSCSLIWSCCTVHAIVHWGSDLRSAVKYAVTKTWLSNSCGCP